ncbi:MAG: cytochrome c biogenesis heme-transporting ATPase CcmA [Porticoccus sp.]|nr:cytochrome c biogenesis heme-transporting ATPase CcmA [Porticoccus sp.]
MPNKALPSTTSQALKTLELKALSFERDDRLLFSDVCVSLQSGDILQVEGPNGCGKTTLLRIITTALNPLSGQLLWQGKNVSGYRQSYLQNLLFLGHLPGLKQSLSPEENLVWWRRLNSSHRSLSNTEALAHMGLQGYEDIPCFQLSAGQQRRAALSRLLITEAPLWVLDEPFTAIDKQGVSELEILLTTHAEKGGIIILSTHQDLGIKGLKRLSLSALTEAVL